MTYHQLLKRQLSECFPNYTEMDADLRQFLLKVSASYELFEATIQTKTPISLAEYEEIQEQIRAAKDMEFALIEAKELAENAATAKSDFLSVMSHEIRTPLNAIIGNVHLLRQENPLPSQEEYLRVLHISAENLLSLINDILDFGKIEEGKIAFAAKDMDIRRLVNNLKAANRMRAEERGNRLRVMFDGDIPSFVRGDEVRLSQVLNNLISNAVKFTKNGSITIEAELHSMDDFEVSVYFSVVDSGIGIDKDKQELIFERFTQADSDITRQFGGSGLGLAIIRRLLQLQGSDIEVESERGRGSKFSFIQTFSKSEVGERGIVAPVQQDHNLNGAKILLVEDVEFNVRVAEKMLQNWNALVDVAENGLIAIQKVKTTRYSLILMDLQMPVMDGYRAAMAIRELDEKVPIIALTASVSSDITEKVYDVGMNDYVSKPFNPDDLYSTVVKNIVESSISI